MSLHNFNELKVFDDAVDNMDIIRTIIAMENQEDSFYIADIGDIINKHLEWITKMPKVVPHYGTFAMQVSASFDNFFFDSFEARIGINRCFSEFSAVKCNPDPTVVKVLAALNAGFDCASEVNYCAFYCNLTFCRCLAIMHFLKRHIFLITKHRIVKSGISSTYM